MIVIFPEGTNGRVINAFSVRIMCVILIVYVPKLRGSFMKTYNMKQELVGEEAGAKQIEC